MVRFKWCNHHGALTRAKCKRLTLSSVIARSHGSRGLVSVTRVRAALGATGGLNHTGAVFGAHFDFMTVMTHVATLGAYRNW